MCDTDAFLQRLPARVIRSGNIVDIRGDIAAQLGSGKDRGHRNVTLIQTPVSEFIKEQSQQGDLGTLRPKTPGDIATIQVRYPCRAASPGLPLSVERLRADGGRASRYATARKP